MALSLSGSRGSAEADSMFHEQAQLEMETLEKSEAVPLWVYVVGALVLLAINVGWRRG